MNDTKSKDPRETPDTDPRDREGEGSTIQTDKPWKQNPQSATDPSLPDMPKPDLEKWQRTKTY